MKTRISWLALAVVAAFAFPASARENATDWYVQDFHSRITANKDSSLDIVEDITADCGTAQGKHGIFRIVPEAVNIEGEYVATPVELVSITDFNGRKIGYSESRNDSDRTVTWKIGDQDRTVQGINRYRIRYRVENAVRFANQDFDELYWNLSGNFWDLEIDHFSADLEFPSEITESNSHVWGYSGYLRDSGDRLSYHRWTGPSELHFETSGTLLPGQGVTASVTFPKGIFVPYVPGFWETHGKYFSLLIPLLILVGCFLLWRKYGRDPRVDKTIIAEYEIPGGLSPLEAGMLMKNGGFRNAFVTAEIIQLAVRGYMTIKEVDKKVLFIHSKDYELIKAAPLERRSELSESQKIIYDKLFERGDTVKLSSLRKDFHKALDGIQRETKASLYGKKLISKTGNSIQIALFITGIISVSLIKVLAIFSSLSSIPFFSIISSVVIMLFFAIIMPKRTPEGAELNWKLKGFKLFMETVDKDRAAFYEKENIFEKCLPYAILFGMTKEWVKRIREIYGEEYFASHPMLWYAGGTLPNMDSFADSMESLSSSIASNTSAPSGSGGAGGSGGGGGGGGGGGW